MMKGVIDVFKLLDGCLTFFDENDLNCERSAKSCQADEGSQCLLQGAL
jgi:hypothetical protein